MLASFLGCGCEEVLLGDGLPGEIPVHASGSTLALYRTSPKVVCICRTEEMPKEQEDLRQQFYLETSKTGDRWLHCKHGAWLAILLTFAAVASWSHSCWLKTWTVVLLLPAGGDPKFVIPVTVPAQRIYRDGRSPDCM